MNEKLTQAVEELTHEIGMRPEYQDHLDYIGWNLNKIYEELKRMNDREEGN